jgi:hypothetical protein
VVRLSVVVSGLRQQELAPQPIDLRLAVALTGLLRLSRGIGQRLERFFM